MESDGARLLGRHEAGGAFSDKPVLVFWEMTRACPLSCIHCRASAISDPLPGELTTDEGYQLIDEVVRFGKPYPTVIFTGGDPLKRGDLFDILRYASARGVGSAASPAVSDALTTEALERLKASGTASISISLDGAGALTHDTIRRKAGTFEKTLWSIQKAVEIGLHVQVNTVVMEKNVRELPAIFHLIKGLGVKTWEVFFLVKVGRGSGVEDILPEEYEDACNFLYDASRYGITVRTVEAPFIRRIAAERARGGASWRGEGYLQMASELVSFEGDPTTSTSSIRPRGTLDGDGIIFVSYDGAIHPGGLLPTKLGDIRTDGLVSVYREHGLLKRIRDRDFRGSCGACGYRSICGGSRARANAYSGDPLETDPACLLAARLMKPVI
ncbi:MAG: TIGR04053 family radical SAM/SPASM domain-containing protein [Nitrososphaerota archaeon]|nr:TIGR04053 family radical SAM/SPASM domain-containing protein [Nitrososphaerota archaeon]